MTIDDLIARARAHGFEDLEAIERLARSAVVLTPSSGDWGKTRSRFGGLPDLPASVPWPQYKGRSQAFIAQIELSSRPPVAVQLGLPQEGLLLFFYDAEQSTWGFDPKDAGSFAVMFLPESTPPTERTDWPADLPDYARYQVSFLSSVETVMLPPWDSRLVQELHLDPERLDAYQNLLDELSGGAWASRGLLGGHPDQIQNDMPLDCELVSARIYCGDGSAYQDPRLPLFRQRARDWRLLLQVPSVEDAGMMWGGSGCLYYWIREEDLAARRFDRVWMILQCT
jgi:uncharacterized protein YwqG